MECLLEELTLAMNSVKRSPLDSLERADTVVKKKINIKNSPTWGPVLADKPRTRTHGNVKIMDKAAAYMMKKNLEIPATFKGKSFATLDPNELASHTAKVDCSAHDAGICLQLALLHCCILRLG